jgi:hypothetical protein
MACNFAALPELKSEAPMTNAEARMTHQARRPNLKCWKGHIFALTVLLWCGCVSEEPHSSPLLEASPHEPRPHLAGRISGSTYTSSRGGFSVPFPVSPDENGRVVHDDAQSVTFHDKIGSKISFYSREFNAQSSLVTAPHSEARSQALEAFMKAIYGDSIAPHYHQDVLDGALSFIDLKLPGPESGVATFIHGNRVYLVETDLLPAREFVSKAELSQDAQDKWLENRAVELLRTMDVK